MNLLYFIQKELYEVWFEATNPLFPASSPNDFFYTDLFNHYQSLNGKIIDNNNGESLFQQQPMAPIPTKAKRQTLSETSSSAGFPARNWKTV